MPSTTATRLVLVLLLASGSRLAHADETSATPERKGLVASGGLGLGGLGTTYNDEAVPTLNYELRFGGFIRSDLALLIDLWGGTHDANGGDEGSFHNFNRGVALQFWPLQKLWLKGTLAISSVSVQRWEFFGDYADLVTTTYVGTSVGGAIGYEVYRNLAWSVDLEGRATLMRFADVNNAIGAFALQAAVNFNP
jgi:hypothetical protein